MFAPQKAGAKLESLAIFDDGGGNAGGRTPVIEKWNARQNNQEAKRGAHRADHPQVQSQGNGREQEDERRPGIAPGAIGPGEVGFFFAQAEQSNRIQGEEDPDSEDKQ